MPLGPKVADRAAFVIDSLAPLAGKRAFVVGGSGGLGAAVAKGLARRGASLLIHGGSSGPRLEATLDALRAEGAEADGFLAQIEKVEDTGALFDAARETDILVLSYGPFHRAALHETALEDWVRLSFLNLALPGALASAALPHMRNKGWGRILLFGGTRTDQARAFRTNAAYAACKTALITLTKSLAATYAGDGIASLLACPGYMDTEYLDPAYRAEFGAKAPRGRLSPSQALGERLADLLADEPPLWNGAVLTLDEGLAAT